jgi:alkanesulfonate monooxygenase SsuD/methylene tetrahydromethanopterin reductase-like flavin-dependent oxidoreductase (luciferase family)
LGVLAYTLPLHPPALLAEEIAVLDHLSGGRLEVGLGLGHRVEELNANGIDPAQRVTIFQERLAVLEGLLSGGQVTFESEHSVLRNLAINPLPLQQPFPPLWYAGTDPTAATWAGSRGMSLAIGFAPVKALLPTVVGFEAGRERRGHSAEPRTERIGAGRISLMQHVYIAENDDRAFAEMRSDLERMRAVTQQHQESSETERKAAAHADVDHLLASGVFLAGGPERVAEGILHARKELGVDLFLANPFAGGVEDERVLRTLSYLQGDVRQALDHAATQA